MRVESIEQNLQRIIANYIREELNDPKLGFITITQVRTSKDLDNAKVYINVLGNADKLENTLKTLNKVRGRIKSECARKLKIRKIPNLIFEYDNALEKGMGIEMILKRIKD